MKRFLYLIIGIVFLTSCNGYGEFSIEGNVEGFGTGNLRVVYFDRGAVQSVSAPALNGRFSMTGRIQKPTLVRIYTNNGALVGRLIAKQGDKINASFKAGDPSAMKIKGNDQSEALAKFVRTHADIIKANDTRALNSAIANYVRQNPGQPAAAALLTDFFVWPGNEATGEALLKLLKPEALRVCSASEWHDLVVPLAVSNDSLTLPHFDLPGINDSVVTIGPGSRQRTLLMWTTDESRRSDSIIALLQSLGRMKKPVTIVDISCDPDTLAWHNSVRATYLNDEFADTVTAKVISVWSLAPYNIAGLDDLPVARCPWFVVADTTGRVLYRGASADGALKKIKPVKKDKSLKEKTKA